MAFMAGFAIFLIFKRLMNDFLFVLLFGLGVAFDTFFLDETSRSSPARPGLTTDGKDAEKDQANAKKENIRKFYFQVTPLSGLPDETS
jgi:hypothetical protein